MVAAVPDGSLDAGECRYLPLLQRLPPLGSSCLAWPGVNEEARRAPAPSGPAGFRGAPGGDTGARFDRQRAQPAAPKFVPAYRM